MVAVPPVARLWLRRKGRTMLSGKIAKARLARTLLCLVAGFFSAVIAPARADNPQRYAISDEASVALARMSKTLSAKQFSFDARTFRSYVGANGELLHIAHTLTTIFRRPDRLSLDVSGDDGSIKIRYDGETIVIFGVEQKQYARIPVSGSIDKALDALQERTGTDFPLADLLSDDPGGSVLAGVTSGGQVGMSTIDDVPCRHFFFSQAPDMEFELWLEDNEQSLPRRFVVTYRSVPGRPTFIAELSNWDFSIDAPDSDFGFDPPVGVTEVELKSKATGTSVPRQ